VQKIAVLKEDKRKENDSLIDLEQKIVALKFKLSSSIVHYDQNAIKDALSKFFAGWMSVMPAFNPTGVTMAQETYNKTIADFKLEQV